MIDKISVPILKLSGFMGFAAVAALAAGAVYFAAVGHFRWDKKRLSVLGLFFGLSGREMVQLSLCWLRLMNLIYLFVFFVEFEQVRLAFFIMMGLMLALICGKLARAVMECLNTVLLAGGVTAANLLASYMKEIQFEWGLMAVYGLLALFTVGYCYYFTLKAIRELSEERREGNAVV